jgi:hypothetical protein
VFAPHQALRAAITPADRGARHADAGERLVPKHVSMTWMQRLKRVFAIEIETCRRCGGKLKVVASIEDPALIERILAHLKQRPETEQPAHRSLRAHRPSNRRSSDPHASPVPASEESATAALWPKPRARSNFRARHRKIAYVAARRGRSRTAAHKRPIRF